MNKQELINLIQRNENEGKLTFQTIEGICEASIKDFIKQPTAFEYFSLYDFK